MPLAYIVGRARHERPARVALAAAYGHAATCALGAAVLESSRGTGGGLRRLRMAVLAGVVPFLPGLVVKSLATGAVAAALRTRRPYT